MREIFLSRKMPKDWSPRYGDFIAYPKTPTDREDSDGIGICHCGEPNYVLVWTLGKGGWKKVAFNKGDCRPVSSVDYPRTVENVKFYRQYDLMMNPDLQAQI